jgi:peptide/nickel transport system substrate-binding protein
VPLQNPSLRTIMFGLNHGDDELHAMPGSGENPTADVRVRRALWHAIDMDAIQARVMRGKSRNAGIMIAPPITGYVEAIDTPLDYDPERAKELLAEAGYADGFAMGLDCPNDRYVNDEEICVAVAGMWAQIGVDVQLTAQTRSNHFAKVDRGETDAYMIGWATLPTMDGFSPLRAMLATREDGWGGNNPNGFSHPRIDELARLTAVEIEEEQRVAMLAEAMTIAREEVAYLPLHQQPLSWAVRDGVNVIQFPDNYFRAWHYTMD